MRKVRKFPFIELKTYDILTCLCIETFLLFSQEIPSQNLGFIDSRSNTVDVVIHGQDISVRQSPSVLTSTRAGGTTGAGMTLDPCPFPFSSHS